MVNFKFLFTPFFALIFSVIISIASIFISREFYYYQFEEISLITFNIKVLSWCILCCIFYAAGLLVCNKIYPISEGNNKVKLLASSEGGLSLILSLLVFCILLNSFGIYQLVKSFGSAGFLKALMGVSDVDLRLAVYYALKTVNTGWAIAFTTPVLCLSYVYYRLRKTKIIAIILSLTLFVYVLLILATQSKGPLLTTLTALAFCEIFLKYPKITFKKRDILRISALLFSMLAFFIIIQSRRNADVSTIAGFSKEISAYTLVSYNRLAYLLEGRLSLPNMYNGFWTNRWFWGLPGEEYIDFGLRKLQFDIPYNSFDAWLDTFQSVNNAGLNPKYIWVTIFGEPYADYGWFGFLWFLPYGFVSQFAYSALTRGRFEFFAFYPLLIQWNMSWYSGATVGGRSTLFCVLIMLTVSMRHYFRLHKEKR